MFLSFYIRGQLLRNQEYSTLEYNKEVKLQEEHLGLTEYLLYE